MDAESLVEVLEVLANGSCRDVQRPRDLLVGHPEPNETQHLSLAFRERGILVGWRGGPGEERSDVRHEQGHQESLTLTEAPPAFAYEQQTTRQPGSIRVADQEFTLTRPRTSDIGCCAHS